MIAGIVPTDGVHLTTTPSRTINEVTLVGASGKEYVFACAVGTINESRSAAAIAEAQNMAFDEVIFMEKLKRGWDFGARWIS